MVYNKLNKHDYIDKITEFIIDEIYSNSSEYNLYQSLEDVASNATIDAAEIEDIKLTNTNKPNRYAFSGKISIDVTFSMSGEEVGGSSFPGKFNGFIEDENIDVEDISIDTSSFYIDESDE